MLRAHAADAAGDKNACEQALAEVQQMVASGHVRYWHKADISICTAHVRYWG